MLKNSFKLEILIVWSQSILTEKQFIFLSSVLVGISSAFAVIVLKTFAHWVFFIRHLHQWYFKLSFINSILPIADS
jgi:CIC family chloride channel protein